ncbi:uncharacterized protein LOC116428223 isoform X2 [Nomia melanderi]
MYNSLNATWGIAKILYLGNRSIIPSECYMGIHNRARKALAIRFVNNLIYQACKSILNNKEIKLSTEQRKILEKYILEGKLNALAVTDRTREIHDALTERIINKTKEYAHNLEESIKLFKYTIRNPTVMKDFPEDALKAMAKDVEKYNVGPWLITLRPHILKPFMEYCPVRSLRQSIWEADVTKASVLQERLLNTSTPLEQLRALRQQRAELLGYKTYVHLSLETKMAESIENIYHTFDILLGTARPAQEYELMQLNSFANENGFAGTLQFWDIPFWSRKQLFSIHKYKEGDFKQYFPLPKVLSGTFELIERLFNVKIVESENLHVWHNDVHFFDVFDLNESSNEPVGSFYLDPYARNNEKVKVPNDSGHIVPINSRSKVSKTKPLVALLFNFQPPTEGKPSLLYFKDVKAIFQKFGRMLQHILTKVDYAELSGLTNVEWDAAYISDHFFENWLYEPSILHQISSHYDTKESLSAEMIKTLKDTKLQLAGFNLCKELYLSRFDLELHFCDKFWGVIMNRLWNKHFIMPQHKLDSHICSFESIFSGNFGAAYYSHIWSQMLAADLYSIFKEISVKNSTRDAMREIGDRYYATFLSVGGSQPMSETFRKFTGRDPNPIALLLNLELDDKSTIVKSRI